MNLRPKPGGRKAPSAERIAARVLEHRRVDRQKAEPNVTPLNPGFFELESMRVRKRAVKRK